VGFTWYSLTDQVDWDTALRENHGNQNPLGLYDLDRNIRPVGEAYKKLISQWKQVLPTQTACLQIPLVMPQDSNKDWARQKQVDAKATQRKHSATTANAPLQDNH
jgi:hypothetical protein